MSNDKTFYVYIASSRKNKTTVELLQNNLEHIGCEVLSFLKQPFANIDETEKWYGTSEATNVQNYCVFWAKQANLVIYISPSGCDTWAEIGMAFANKQIIYGLKAKDDPVGIMRKLINLWFDDYSELLLHIQKYFF